MEEENVKDLTPDTSKLVAKKNSKSSAPPPSKKTKTITINKLKPHAQKAITVELDPDAKVASEHAESDNFSLDTEGLKVK